MKKRKMKKTLPLLVLLLVVLIGGFLIIKNTMKKVESAPNPTPTPTPVATPTPEIPVNKELKEKLKKLDNVQERIDYFQMEFLDRYLAYQEKNPTLSKEDIVTRVNIGLDHSYYTNTTKTIYENQIYILSNKYISLGEYIPENLQKVDASCSNGTRELVGVAKTSFETMCKAAKEEGYTIRVMSAYRSYKYQITLYQNYVKQDGVTKADTYSARPGFSEHQTGLVADIDNGKTTYTSFHTTKEYEWMKSNAHKFGWIERYPKGKEDITGYTYESWHYRYVGEEIATKMKKENITFDEYYVRYIENKK